MTKNISDKIILANKTHKNYLNASRVNSFEQQYGFRNKLSTNHALIDITNRIQEACDNAVSMWNLCRL